MSTLKKILSLSLALAMLMSVSVFAGFADADEIDKDAAAAVELLAAVKILNGIKNEEGTFDFAPTATIQRDQAAKMIYVLRNGGVDDGAETWKAAVSFADVAKDNWAAGYIAYCETYGIIDGYAGMFEPEKPLTGVQLAKLLLTVAGYKGDVEGYTGTGWEKNVIADANEVGLFAGVKDAISLPISRQYAAVMFKNAFDVKVPTYIGDYRVDGILGNEDNVKTVAQKFLDFAQEDAYVLSTKTATVDGTFASAAGKVELDYVKEGKATAEVTFAVADALVGQMVTVTTINDKIVTIAATGKTIAGELKVGAKITSGTDKDKYPVTVGGVSIGNKATNYVICDTLNLTVQNVLDQQAKNGNNIAYTAYDVDGDKTVEYITTVTTTYDEVTVASDKSFTVGSFAVDKDGKYTLPGTSTKVAVTIDGIMESGIIAGYTYDELYQKYSVTAAQYVPGKFEGINSDKTVFTVGGKQYKYADKTIAVEVDFLTKYENMNQNIDLYTDGEYVLYAKKYEEKTGSDTTIDTKLPSNLAYLIDGARVAIEESKTDEWGNPVPADDIKYTYKVKVLFANTGKESNPLVLETTEAALKNISYVGIDKLFDEETGKFNAEYMGVYEWTLSTNGNLILKAGFADVDGAHFYVNGEKAQTVDSNKDMGTAAVYQSNTMFKDTLIRGTENTLVFAKYTNDKSKTEYKVIKMADLLAKDAEVTKTELLAAEDKTLGEALLVYAEYKYVKPQGTSTTTTPYIVAASAPEYVVEGNKIYQVFTAVDLNNAGAAITYKADAETELKITAGEIYKISVKDGLVESATLDTTWKDGSIQASVADLLLIKYDDTNPAKLVETKGDAAKTYFANGCKIIVKNGTAYKAGNVSDLVVAGQNTDKSYKDNISYVLDEDGKLFTYIIIDLAKCK